MDTGHFRIMFLTPKATHRAVDSVDVGVKVVEVMPEKAWKK